MSIPLNNKANGEDELKRRLHRTPICGEVLLDRERGVVEELILKSKGKIADIDLEIKRIKAIVDDLVHHRLDDRSNPRRRDVLQSLRSILQSLTMLTPIDLESLLERFNTDGESLFALNQDTDIIAYLDYVNARRRKERTTEENRMLRFRAAIAPHNRLPVELLVGIFVHCLDGKHITIPPDMNSAPWVLAQVCSRWRQIALNEPQLFNSIFVNFRKRKLGQARGLKFLHDIISRTRPSSLLSLRLSPVSTASLETAVIPYSKRLKDLRITLSIPAAASLLPRPPGLFESLESVVLEFSEHPYGLDDVPITVFKDARNLRELELHYRSKEHRHQVMSPGNQLHFPWAQLTDLHFIQMSPPPFEILQILGKCPQLVGFTLSYNPSAFSDNQMDALKRCAPITVANLRSFEFAMHDPRTAGIFLKKLVLPALEDIQVSSESFEYVWPHADFLSLFTRSTCQLKSFLTNCCILPCEFNALFAIMPKLEDLELQESCRAIPQVVFDNMISGDLLPKLKSLKCSVKSVHAIISLLETRWDSEEGGIVNAKVYAHDFYRGDKRLRDFLGRVKGEERDIAILEGNGRGWDVSYY